MGGCLTREPEVDFNGPVDFNHFHILRAIGKGAFGKVCIVKKKDTKEMYAMKYMNKVQIIRKHAVENVFRESEILQKLEHAFLVNLWFTFQDQEDLFMVLNLMLGGDISYHLEKEGRFAVSRVRLYIAELSLALEYLRENRVIHRDVKPANMLLDSGGHVHLTDFNVACVVHSGVPVTSVTGTKPYMAPEVLHSQSSAGYSYAVDWWGLGVSVYEMLRGQRPFSIDRHMTNEEIVSSIRHTRPSASVRWDHQTCDLLRMLLHPNEDKRLQNVASLKQHRFFENTNWDQVENKETTPIYVPAQNRIHCDPTHELEEMIVEPNPLHKKQHRLSRRNFRVEDETLLEELERLGRKFPEYNRMKVKEAERRKRESAELDGQAASRSDSIGNASGSLAEKPNEQRAAESSDQKPRATKSSPEKSSSNQASQPPEENSTSQQQREVSDTLEKAIDRPASGDSSLKQVVTDEQSGRESGEPAQQQPHEEEVKEEVRQEVEEEVKEPDKASVSREEVVVQTVSEVTGVTKTTGNDDTSRQQDASLEDEEDPEEAIESSAESPVQRPTDTVERTDSMNSAALLLPREI